MLFRLPAFAPLGSSCVPQDSPHGGYWGGSTEFVIGREGKPLFATSLKLGHIRLTDKFAREIMERIDYGNDNDMDDIACPTMSTQGGAPTSIAVGPAPVSPPISCPPGVLCAAGGVAQRQQIEDMRRHIRVLLADSGVLEVVRR